MAFFSLCVTSSAAVATLASMTRILAALGFVVVALAACASDSGDSGGTVGQQTGCVPGDQKACACPGGAQGAQACSADGKGYADCVCGAGGAGGASGAGGGAGAGGAAMVQPAADCVRAKIDDNKCADAKRPYAWQCSTTDEPITCVKISGTKGWVCCP